jgi:integrase
MSVRQRKWTDAKGKAREAWVVDVVFVHPDGREERIQKTSPVNTRRGAEQYERDLRASLLGGTYGKSTEAPTLNEFVEEFLAHADGNNKHSTGVSKRQILRDHVQPYFGTTRLDRIGPAEVEKFKAHLRKKPSGARARKEAPTQQAVRRRYGAPAKTLSLKTINNCLAVLSKLLKLAAKYRKIPFAPEFDWLKTGDPEFDFFQFDEADRLVGAAEVRWRPLIVVALNTGLRIGELVALRWDCVDLVAGRLIVKRTIWRGVEGLPKGGRSREVPLNGKALAALREARKATFGPFVFSPGAEPLTDNELKQPLWRNCRAAGLREVGWHVLRHTFASHLVMRGVPLKAVQELLGHSSMEMTMRYAHLSPVVRSEAVAVLDDRPSVTLTQHEPFATSNPAVLNGK